MTVVSTEFGVWAIEYRSKFDTVLGETPSAKAPLHRLSAGTEQEDKRGGPLGGTINQRYHRRGYHTSSLDSSGKPRVRPR